LLKLNKELINQVNIQVENLIKKVDNEGVTCLFGLDIIRKKKF
jgi:hypothetical protein